MFQKLNFDLEVFKKSLMFKSLITKTQTIPKFLGECLYDNFSSHWLTQFILSDEPAFRQPQTEIETSNT
jgi:hypothetical protein